MSKRLIYKYFARRDIKLTLSTRLAISLLVPPTSKCEFFAKRYPF